MEEDRISATTMKLTLRQRANLILSGLAVGFLVLFSFSPTEHTFYPVCPFHALTGLQCPGCGGTRALYQLLHLHWAEAMRLNGLVTLLAPVALLWFVFWYYSVMRYDRAPGFKVPRAATICFGAIAVLFAVARNVT
jgi:4-amino-4-deoxy-L-arabinose transferase-like glycosyltransferase